jgi:hypothetical protein
MQTGAVGDSTPYTHSIEGCPSPTKGSIMKKLLIGAVAAGALMASGGIASATPGQVDCSNPCVNKAKIAAAADSAIPLTGAPWTDFFITHNQWERFTDPNNDGQGAWEKGVQAVNGGAWEKAFPPAP